MTEKILCFLKNKAFTTVVFLLGCGLNQTYGQCAATTGIKTVGPGADYATLGAAITDLSTNGFTGSVVLELQPNFVAASETYPVTIPAMPCITGTNTITIRPAASVTTPKVFTTTGTRVIELDNARNVILDGRPGGTGTTSMFTINSNATGAITLKNGSQFDTLRYLSFTCNNENSTTGMLHFGLSSGAAGNSYNVVTECTFDRNATAMPASCLTAGGTAGKANVFNSIVNNRFSNFSGDDAASHGIYINTNCSGWFINGNSFFQTTAVGSTPGKPVYCIRIKSTDSMNIRGNYIGGNAPLAMGTWVSNTTSNDQRIIGISLEDGNGGDPAMVDSNIITGFNFPTSYISTTAGGCFSGIYISGTTSAKIGVNDGNLIGSMTANNVIKVTSSGSVSTSSYGAGINGISYATTGSLIIANNKIGGLSMEGSSASKILQMAGILAISNTGNITIQNNTIGGDLPNSIRSGTSTTSGVQNITGIREQSSSASTTTGNTIRNLSVIGNGSSNSLVQGIQTVNSSASTSIDVIEKNSIYGLSNSTGSGCYGIKIENAYALIRSNNIHDLVQTNSNGTAGDALHAGIYNTATTGTLTLAYNTIQRIFRTGTAPNGDNSKGTIAGIAGSTNATLKAHNNTIVLDSASAPITKGASVIGIRLSTNNNQLYNNLIKINAETPTAACLYNSAISISTAPTSTLISANNNTYYINPRNANYIYIQGSAMTSPGKAFINCSTCPVTSAIVYDANFNNPCSAYKQYISNSAGREGFSSLEDITFGGGATYPDNLQPMTTGASYAQNGGLPLGYSTDILNNPVSSTTPDIGAMEFSTGTSLTPDPPLNITPSSVSMNCGDATAVALTSNVPATWTLGGGDLYTNSNATMSYSGTATTSVFAKAVNNRYIYGSYTVGSCTSSDSAFITVNNATSNILANETGAFNTDSSVVRNVAANLHNTDCELMASVMPAGGTPVSGWLTGKVIMDASVQNTATGPYVTRHFELTPETNAATSNATVTLYFTQAEFDAYNTYVTDNGNSSVNPLLPSAPGGSTASILVDKFNAASGSPSPTNNNSAVAITPTSVTWDSTNNWWAVTFPTTGFSGFFLHTNVTSTPLPIVWKNVSATLNRQKQAVINWSVAEKEAAAYHIQKSTDGSRFEKIATVNSKGNGNNAYSFTEALTLSGKAWYRIVQVGKNGKEDYSKIMALQNSSIYGRINIYPNPATQVLTVETEAAAAYSIYDLQGKAVMKGNLQNGKNTLHVSGLAKGFYTIKIGDYNQKIVLQ